MVRPHPDHRPSVFNPRREAPPNYFARRVQVKILVLVFLFMTILMLMGKARDPDSWSWMWRLDKSRQMNGDTPADSKPIDTRPPRHPASEPTDSQPVVTGSMPTVQPRSLLGDSLQTSIQQTQLSGWQQILRELNSDQRQQLFEVLWSARHNKRLDREKQASWVDVLDQLDQAWTHYAKAARTILAQDQSPLTDEQTDRVEKSIESSISAWKRVKPALATAVTPSQLTTAQRTQLQTLQTVLDQVAVSRIEDNTVLGRAGDREAWFRFWEFVQATDELPPDQETVTFVQLFSQPDAYRGRLVRLRGVARMAYHVSASRNPYGISGYYVLAVRLNPTDQSPVIVYTLEIPTGFPKIPDRDQDGSVLLREPIELTGVFFKRWVYQSASGPNLAPLVLARITRWQPEQSKETRALPDPLALLAGVLGTAILGVFIAWWVYRRSNRSPIDRAKIAPPAQQLASFNDRAVRESVAESLEKLRDPSIRNDGHV